jgi:hypothetical protein
VALENFLWRGWGGSLDLYGALSAINPSSSAGLLDTSRDFPSVTDDIRMTHGGNATVARRQHGLEEDERHLKVFVVIYVFF